MNTLTAMRVFDRVCLMGSLSAAARELNMSTTAVSRLVKELEDDLGVRLLNRTTRRMTLTEAGRAFSVRGRHILDELQELQDATRGLHSDTRGLLRVSCSNMLAHARISRLVPEFLAEHPLVTIDFHLTTRYVIGLVEEGYDLAVRFGEQTDSALVARKLGAVPNHVVATPGYLDRHGRPVHPDDLAGHGCVLSSFAKGVGVWPFRTAGGALLAPVSGRVSSNSVEAAFQMTLAGFGIGNLPSLLVDEPVRDGRLEILLEEFRPEASPIYAIYPHRTHVPAKVRAFIDFLARELAPDFIA